MSAITRVRPWAVWPVCQCQYTHHHALIWTNNYLEILVPFPNIHCLYVISSTNLWEGLSLKYCLFNHHRKKENIDKKNQQARASPAVANDKDSGHHKQHVHLQSLAASRPLTTANSYKDKELVSQNFLCLQSPRLTR